MSEQGFATIPRSMLHDPEVPRDAKLVYLVLSSHVGGNRSAWPSHKRLADLLGMSLSTVKRQLRWLRDHGFISWESRIGDNDARITNEYVLLAGSRSGRGNKHGSVRPGGPTEPGPGSDGPTPPVSETDPLGQGDRTEEESFKESHSKAAPAPNDSPNPKPEKVPTTTADPRFAEFWMMCPRKVAKADAFRQYQAAIRGCVTSSALLEGMRRYALSVRGTDPKFVVHPSTWLHQGRWDDEIATARGATGKATEW